MIEYIELAEQQTAVIHLTVARADIAQVMEPAVAEIIAVLTRQGAQVLGPMYSFHWCPPTDTFDFEVGFPIDRAIQLSGRVKMSTLPECRAASTVHHGPYEKLALAWSEFCAQLRQEGQVCAESSFEYYLVGAESVDDPECFRTRLFKPLI